MMKLLLPFILLISFEAQAQKTLNQGTFQTNVRPVLVGILSDFYQMIALFPEFPKEVISVVEGVDGLYEAKEELHQLCPRQLQLTCLQSINQLRTKLSNIQARTLELQARQQMASNLYLSNLAGLRTSNEFMLTMENLKGELDNAAFILKAGALQKKSTVEIIKQIDDASTYISLTVIEYIPFSYKEEFRHFYFNFIRPLQQQISKQQNYEFLNRNLNSLNFAINLLNQSLTKKNKKTPEGMGPYLSLIHNRWNSLLRYYF